MGKANTRTIVLGLTVATFGCILIGLGIWLGGIAAGGFIGTVASVGLGKALLVG